MTRYFKRSDREKKTFLIDAAGKTLGRLCSEITKILRGKHTPFYTPNEDLGDAVVVINASQIHVTGAKAVQKKYDYYTGYMGGRREIPYQTMLDRKPEFIIETTVKGMMPSNRLARKQIKKLKVYKEQHNLTTQMIAI